MWKVLKNEVDLGDPTSFFDHVYMGCIQDNAKQAKILWTITEPCLNPEIPAKATEKITMFGKSAYLFAVLWHGRDMPRNVWKDIVSWRTKRLNNSTKYQHRALTTIHFKEELESVGELSRVCSQIVLKCLYLARIGIFDILWSVNKIAQSITKWTKACDKRQSGLISYIHHTCEYKQYCHVRNIAKKCRLGLFQDSVFAGDVEDSESTSVGTLCIFHTFVPISWMCKKQTSVSHSSTE